MGIRTFFYVFIFTIISYVGFYLYTTSTLTTLEKSRAADVTTNIESVLTSIAHDELTLSIDDSLRKENVVVITKDDSAVIDAIQNRFMEYVKSQPNLVFNKNDVKVALHKGAYRTSGSKLVQLPSDYPKIEIEVKGAYRNGAGIKNSNSNDDLIKIQAFTSIQLEQLNVNKLRDERDDKTIKGDDFEGYGIKYDNGVNFRGSGIR